MSSQKNTITINGKVYDATTGNVIASPLPFKHVVTPTNIAQTTKPQTVDGIVRQTKNTSERKDPVVKPVNSIKIASAKKTAHRHSPAESTDLHQKTLRTKTLMRNIVKQPSTKNTEKTAVAFSGLVSQPEHKIVHSSLPERITRSSSVSKSHRISKFAQDSTPEGVTKKIETIPVKAAPRKHDSTSKVPPVINHAPPIIVKQSVGGRDYFEQAMQNATSHQPSSIGNHHAHKRHKRSRLMQIGAIAATVFILGGFFAYNNAPNVALKNASSRTGISASIPAYKPSGYRLNRDVQYLPGKVVINYESNIDDRAFSITQEKTSLDNQSLAANFSSSATEMVLTQTPSGTPIYIYNDSNATWIKDGIKYNVQGDAQLSRSQLLNLASSL